MGVAERQLLLVIFGLPHPFGQLVSHRLGLNHRQLGVAISQDVVRGKRLAVPPLPLDPARGDGILSSDATSPNHTSAGGCQRKIDMLGSVFGFVHPVLLLKKNQAQNGT